MLRSAEASKACHRRVRSLPVDLRALQEDFRCFHGRRGKSYAADRSRLAVSIRSFFTGLRCVSAYLLPRPVTAPPQPPPSFVVVGSFLPISLAPSHGRNSRSSQLSSASSPTVCLVIKVSSPAGSLFGWLVADGWCWFVLREEYCWLVAGGWFVLREKYC
jgi:hypothetical protein